MNILLSALAFSIIPRSKRRFQSKSGKPYSCALLVVLGMGHVALGQQVSVEAQLAADRQQIDRIDRQIVDLINQRAAVVKRIGEIKVAAGLPVSVPGREQEVLKHILTIGGSGPFPATRLQQIYSTLLTQMRVWEQEQHSP